MLSHIPCLASQMTVGATALFIEKQPATCNSRQAERHLGWHVVLDETESVHKNDEKLKVRASVLNIFHGFSSAQLQAACNSWSTLCTLHPLHNVKQSQVCWDKLETPFKAALLTQTGTQTVLLCHSMVRPGRLTPPSSALTMVRWS